MRFAIKGPVGNNLDNGNEDVYRAKRAFSKIGYYNQPVENGIIDRELDDAILAFQYNNNLKPDRKMLPGGETEIALKTALKQNQSDDSKSELPPVPPGKPPPENAPPLPERRPDFNKGDNFFDSLKETIDNMKENQEVKDLIEQMKDDKTLLKYIFKKGPAKIIPGGDLIQRLLEIQMEEDDVI